MTLVLIIIGVLVVVAVAGLLIYNRMVSRRNAVDNSWAQIEAALQRRHDLIPNLVETVKGYAKHERQTFGGSRSSAGPMPSPASTTTRRPPSSSGSGS